MTSTRMQCREIQGWCNSRGLEKWGHKMCKGVQAGEGNRQGTGDLTAINNSSVKEMLTWSWMKPVLGVTKRTKK